MQLYHPLESIEAIVERYTKMVFGIAFHYTQSKLDAEDVFQEVFLVYFKKRLLYQSEEHRKAWLIRTTINCSKKSLSRSLNKRTVPLDETEDTSFRFRTDDENMVFASLNKLSVKYRTVLYLFYFEDMSIEAIGRALSLKAGAVKVQLTRGREFLRNELKGECFYE